MNNSIHNVAKQLKISEEQVLVVLNMIKEGSTVPFIARYRKAATNGLDEEVIEKINNLYVYDLDLQKRKDAILKILEESDVLTNEIKNSINKAEKKSEVESIYEPFKIGKKTKATEAIALGLEPLAKKIFNENNPSFNPHNEAKKYLSEKIESIDFAIEQSKLIIAQYISEDIETRKIVKEQIFQYGLLTTKLKRGGEEKDESGRFRNYYEYSEKISKIPNHRIMAINRAENLKIINVKLDYKDSKIKYELNNKFFKIKTTGNIIRESLEDSLVRLIYPSIEREIRSDLTHKAEESAISLFADNLEQMLLHPAIKGKVILSIDPAFVSGCKIAVLGPDGKVLKIDLINPTYPKKDILSSSRTLNNLIKEFKVDIIVIGNGTASRETEKFVSNFLKENNLKIQFAIVSEVGASVYSASKGAIKEFPNLSVEQRSAISIGRRFQDPLNELVKIEPKSIGVGQYQHDVNQKELSNALKFKTLKVVNAVGVDINTATEEILSYISGLSSKVASNIISFRNENGPFHNRKSIKTVPGLGDKTYEQSIGFIRIHDSDEFLDKTQIHPESYKLAKSIIKELNIDIKNIDTSLFDGINIERLAEQFNSNKYDIELIISALKAPEKDIRSEKEGFILKSDILEFKDLKENMEVEGTVQNVTDFGAFVYIGIKEAVLIHISNLSDKFVSHPSEIVKTGQRVQLEIILIDKERKRIQGKLIQ